MTAKQLSGHIEGIDERYLSEALKDLNRQNAAIPKAGRVLVLAAVFATLLALALTAVAANWLGLWDLLLPLKTQVNPSWQESLQSQQTEDNITLTGVFGTPEWQAAAEWQIFLEGYQTSAEDNSVFLPGSSYDYYRVYDETMARKLEDLTERFSLKLHTDMMDIDAEELFRQLGGALLPDDRGSGYLYEDGSFLLEGNIRLPGYGALKYQIFRAVRGSFTDIFLAIGEISRWQEWTVTAADNRNVTLALSEQRGLILAELEDCVVTVNVLGGNVSRETMESLADQLAFSVLSPARPGDFSRREPKIPTQWVYREANSAYTAVLKGLLLQNMLPDGTHYQTSDAASMTFALAEVNGQPGEELLLNCGSTVSAGATGYVLSFDETTGALKIQLTEYPKLSFYPGGVIKAEASHNQGKAGDALWPYTLYRYSPEAGCFRAEAMVDAWDKRLGEVYLEMPFPAYADSSGSGVVYYVMHPENTSLTDPMDITEYQSWYQKQLGEAALEIIWQPLTEEAIRRLPS